MKLGVPHPSDRSESRAPLTPPVVKRLVAAGLEVVVERGVGGRANAVDAEFEKAGARLTGDATEAWGGDIVVTLGPPDHPHIDLLREGAVLVGMLAPLRNHDAVRHLAHRKVTAISLELVPRISRAQAMDVLSSQANIAGYKAVILAAANCPKMFPMMITAAGTLAPARVVVLGVGVAGLQAIATAKRLGAVVEANDVRAATKEQVQSLGARFIDLPRFQGQDDKSTGGYARELTEDEKRQQQELIAKHLIAADAVVTTAAVFGKAPPVLIPREVVARMQPGSVIVDLAADATPGIGRGNCEATHPGQTYTTENGVTIIGTLNLPATVPAHASQVYANNIHALLKDILHTPQGGTPSLTLNLADEVQKGAIITHGGEIVNETVRNAIGGGAA